MNAKVLENAKSTIFDLKQIRPMLASKGNVDDLWDDPNWIAEEKIDGARYVLQRNGLKWSCTSRTVSRKTGLMVDKIENVPHLVNNSVLAPHFVLDGELQQSDFSKTVSIMGSKSERAAKIQNECGPITFYAFDLIEFAHRDLRNLPYIERRAMLEHLVERLNNPYIKVLPIYSEGKRELYDSVVRCGGEGIILKHVDSKYVDGERSKQWLKVKKYTTDDVVICGAEPSTVEYNGKEDVWNWFEHSTSHFLKEAPGANIEEMKAQGYFPVTKGHYYGWINALRFGKYDADGNFIELGRTAGIPDDVRAEVSNGVGGLKVDYFGKCIEIGAMEILKSGKYRHSSFLRFRPDKDPLECIIGANN